MDKGAVKSEVRGQKFEVRNGTRILLYFVSDKTTAVIQSVSDLEVFTLSYAFAMDVFQYSRVFPKEEKYSLTDQIVRASRSIAANIAEGFGKRNYENEFKKHLVYAMGSLEETKAWLLFARDCNYLSEDVYKNLSARCDVLGSKLFKLYQNWKKI